MVLTRRMLTATSASPLPESAAVPQRSSVAAVPQPAVQPARLYVVVDGKVIAVVGAVASTVHVVEVAILVLPAASTARTLTVCDPVASPP